LSILFQKLGREGHSSGKEEAEKNNNLEILFDSDLNWKKLTK
jgi:hypothetical protein